MHNFFNVSLGGIQERNGKLFSVAVPMGLCKYDVKDGDGKWIPPGNEDLVTTHATKKTNPSNLENMRLKEYKCYKVLASAS